MILPHNFAYPRKSLIPEKWEILLKTKISYRAIWIKKHNYFVNTSITRLKITLVAIWLR